MKRLLAGLLIVGLLAGYTGVTFAAVPDELKKRTEFGEEEHYENRFSGGTKFDDVADMTWDDMDMSSEEFEQAGFPASFKDDVINFLAALNSNARIGLVYYEFTGPEGYFALEDKEWLYTKDGKFVDNAGKLDKNQPYEFEILYSEGEPYKPAIFSVKDLKQADYYQGFDGILDSTGKKLTVTITYFTDGTKNVKYDYMGFLNSAQIAILQRDMYLEFGAFNPSGKLIQGNSGAITVSPNMVKGTIIFNEELAAGEYTFGGKGQRVDLALRGGEDFDAWLAREIVPLGTMTLEEIWERLDEDHDDDDTMLVTKEKPVEEPKPSGGGGCNASYGVVGLLLAGFGLLTRKSRKA